MARYKKTSFKKKILASIAAAAALILGAGVEIFSDTIWDNWYDEDEMTAVKKINSIHDGDTINVTTYNNKKVKIRLFGIDAPELKQTFGEDSRECLENMIKNKKISYIARDKSKPTDKYGRVVGMIFADNVNINIEMVKKGCAWNYTRYNQSLNTFIAQINAKKEKLGLWAEDNPQAPWDFRHKK